MTNKVASAGGTNPSAVVYCGMTTAACLAHPGPGRGPTGKAMHMTYPIVWWPEGLQQAAAHLGHHFTRDQRVAWVARFWANNPSMAQVFNIGTTRDGRIAIQGRDDTGQVLTILVRL